jgi:hypothetical protein
MTVGVSEIEVCFLNAQMERDGALGKMSGPWKDQEEQTQLWNPCSAAQSYSLLDHTCTCLIIYLRKRMQVVLEI